MNSNVKGELSNMSFEDLQQLKSKVGTKVYNKTILGPKLEGRPKEIVHKRVNKNRPREESSKIKPPLLRDVVGVKKNSFRDPRFDSICGEFDANIFEREYGFIKEIKMKEKERLSKELKSCKDLKRKEEIKYLVQRMDNQMREESKLHKKVQKEREEKQKQIENLKQGKSPHFIRKSERKVLDLVSRFEELKQSGKLKRHIEKKNKKHLGKDRKKYDFNM